MRACASFADRHPVRCPDPVPTACRAFPARGSTSGIDAGPGDLDFAFVSHAPMEVLTAVADVRTDRAELWFSSQTPTDARASIAAAVKLPERAVRVHVVRGGGSFGRHLTFEAGLEAALMGYVTFNSAD